LHPPRNEINIHPADFNADGFIDLAVHWGRYDFSEGRSRIYFNDGKMTFTDVTEKVGLHEEGLAIKGIGDLNQDGHLDLIVLENKRPEIYLNDGKGNFHRQAGAISGFEAATRPAYVSWGLAVVTDFDNDGIPDILWNGRNFLWLLRGTGGGHFSYVNRQWGIEDKSAASVDDGLCFGDIGWGRRYGYRRLYRQRGFKATDQGVSQRAAGEELDSGSNCWRSGKPGSGRRYDSAQ